MKKIYTHSKQGFTIVELLIVIVVIAILAAISIVAYNSIQERARFSKMRADFSTLQKVVEFYQIQNGSYPDSAACASTSGQANYAYKWCGWVQGRGDSLIPGVVPSVAASIPNLENPTSSDDTYLYQSRASDCTDPGTDAYQLIRFKPSGVSNIEKDSNANPMLMTGTGAAQYNSPNVIAWGVRSSNCSSWW